MSRVGRNADRNLELARAARTTRRAEAADALRGALTRAGLTYEAASSAMAVSSTLLRRWIDRNDPMSVPLSDAAALPLEVREELAQWLVGPSRMIAELPDPEGALDDLRLIAAVQRRTAEAVTSGLDALADGRVCAREGALLELLAYGAIRPLVTLAAIGRAAVDGGVLRMRGGGR